MNVLPRRVGVRIMKGSQARIAPARAAKSPADTKLTVLDRAPPELLEELPGQVVAGRGDVMVVVRGVGCFVVVGRGVVKAASRLRRGRCKNGQCGSTSKPSATWQTPYFLTSPMGVGPYYKQRVNL